MPASQARDAGVLPDFLLVTHFPQALLPFVCRHLMTFSLFSAGHILSFLLLWYSVLRDHVLRPLAEVGIPVDLDGLPEPLVGLFKLTEMEIDHTQVEG